MKKIPAKPEDNIQAEYDFSHGKRGKYAQRYTSGSNVVVLSPDVAEVFTDSESVNRALRQLIKTSQDSKHISP